MRGDVTVVLDVGGRIDDLVGDKGVVDVDDVARHRRSWWPVVSVVGDVAGRRRHG